MKMKMNWYWIIVIIMNKLKRLKKVQANMKT